MTWRNIGANQTNKGLVTRTLITQDAMTGYHVSLPVEQEELAELSDPPSFPPSPIARLESTS